jgi:transposase
MTGSSVAQQIIVGVDTHKDVHVAAAIDVHGRLLGHHSVATTEKGCSALHQWALTFAPGVRYGVEGTGSYGAGLSRFLQTQGSSVVEIRGPSRKLRRDRGKSDTIDAEAAARAVLAGTSRITPKAGGDWVEQLRILRVARRSAAIDSVVAPLIRSHAASMLAVYGVGPEVAGALLVVAGDNPERLRSEASFAALCGVTPLPASSGKTQRHRLNRGGDRRGNTALWRIAMTRMNCDARTREYVRRRTSEGLSKREILRCLKRYIAREIFQVLPRPGLT